MPTLLSVFDLPDDVVSAVTKLKKRGFDDIETYSPAPSTQGSSRARKASDHGSGCQVSGSTRTMVRLPRA